MPCGSLSAARAAHDLQRLAGADARPRRALHLDGGEQVVARHALGPGDLAEGDEAAERHHLPVGAAHADLGDVLRIEPIVAVGLRRDAIGAAEHVEVVDVGRAHEHAHGLEDVGDRHLEHLRLVAVDVDEDLRRRGCEGREDVGDARRAVGLGHEVLRDLREFGRDRCRAYPAGASRSRPRAHAAHRRRDEDERLRLLDLRELAAHLLRDLVDGLALAGAAPRNRRARGTAGRRWWRR